MHAEKMDVTTNDSCDQNITTDAIRQGALALGAPGIACLILNLVGLVAELLFVCRKKNNFLLRLFIYLSVAVTMTVGAYTMFIVVCILPQDEVFCAVAHTILQYACTVELLVIFSVNIVLLYKVFGSLTSRKCDCMWSERLTARYKYIEAAIIVLHFGIPGLLFAIMIGATEKPGYCFTVYDNFQCLLQKIDLMIAFLLFEAIPVLINLLLSLVTISALVVWLCWLRSKPILKARMGTVLKEIGALLGFLVGFCIVAILIESSNVTDYTPFKRVAILSYPLLHTAVPILFFIYMSGFFCKSSKKVRRTDQEKRNNLHTSAQGTAPPSTRISLPSDTAEHLPHFLSPISEEEPSEVTPLINN